jgi:hypothetical protein
MTSERAAVARLALGVAIAALALAGVAAVAALSGRESAAVRTAAVDEHATDDPDVARRHDLAHSYEKLSAAQQDLQTKVDEQNRAIERLRAELARVSEERPPHAAPAPAVPGARAPVRSVIQAASNRDDVFVISAGSKDGVVVGDEFGVHRGGQVVATLVVDKVFPNYASARVKPGTTRTELKAGDEVRSAD